MLTDFQICISVPLQTHKYFICKETFQYEKYELFRVQNGKCIFAASTESLTYFLTGLNDYLMGERRSATFRPFFKYLFPAFCFQMTV